MPFDPKNPFQDDPSQNVPPPSIREQILASLQERMAPVAQPDVATEQNAALMDRAGSGTARAGIQLANAFMGRQSNGDNEFSKNLDDDAKQQLAAAMEKKRMAAEMDKRREELRNGLSTRFVDDANLTARNDTDNKNKISAAEAKAKEDAAAAKAGHGYKMEEIGAMNKGKIDVTNIKGDQKSDKPLETKIVNDKTAMDNTLSLLNTIKAMKNGDKGVGGIATGKMENMRNSAAQMIDVGDPKVSTFKAMVGTQLADYIKSISGAAVSDQERAFLLQNVPSMGDDDETFNAKLDKVTERLTGNRARFIDNVAGSGRKVTDEFRNVGAPPAPAASGPAVGSEQGGYVFKGGDPADKNNWTKK